MNEVIFEFFIINQFMLEDKEYLMGSDALNIILQLLVENYGDFYETK